MDSIRDYLIQIIAAALICGILTRMMGNKGLLGETVKLLAGIFLALTVLGPWVNIRLEDIRDFSADISVDGESVSAEGKNAAYAAVGDIIKARSEAYILDKAGSLGADVSVQICLTEDTLPYPSTVYISGPISPYAKSVLAGYITDHLGISLEDQIWNG